MNFSQLLNNVKNVKNSHIDIKKVRSGVNSGIHAAAAVADPLAYLMGPIGIGVKGGVKAAAKIGTAVTAFGHRYRQDKKFKKDHVFNDVKDVYNFYKKLYVQAKSLNQKEKMESIQHLAELSFGLTAEGFDALVKTRMVENNHFKLSFSHSKV